MGENDAICHLKILPLEEGGREWERRGGILRYVPQLANRGESRGVGAVGSVGYHTFSHILRDF